MLLQYFIKIFLLYQQNQSSASKVKFKQPNNHLKVVIEAAKPDYANKTKESITFYKLRTPDLWQIDNGVLNKDRSALPALFNGPEVLSSTSGKL